MKLANILTEMERQTSKATLKEEDLVADVAKHSSKVYAAAARSTMRDGEISALQSELAPATKRQLPVDHECT